MASCSEPYTSGKNLVSSVKCLIFPLWIQNFNPSSSSSQLSTRPTRSRPNSGHLCRIRFPSNQYPSHIAPHIYELSTLHHSLQMVLSSIAHMLSWAHGGDGVTLDRLRSFISIIVSFNLLYALANFFIYYFTCNKSNKSWGQRRSWCGGSTPIVAPPIGLGNKH
ncbi:transmembrane protein, putative [Medicago truncatula]|uniref:Transmembrane protein, putative n=1 Tax=Medicago truncatula TaxID=3880 RepID=G7K5B2_MEDTR|nr:transmembrane protein, putative [Medicago truncatula]